MPHGWEIQTCGSLQQYEETALTIKIFLYPGGSSERIKSKGRLYNIKTVFKSSSRKMIEHGSKYVIKIGLGMPSRTHCILRTQQNNCNVGPGAQQLKN